VEDAVEVQLARVGGGSEGGIGEPDVSIFAYRKVIWTVQALAFPLLRQNLAMAFLVDAYDPAAVPLADVHTALGIVSQSAGTVRILLEHDRLFARLPLPDRVLRDVSEHESAVGRPDRRFGEAAPGGDPVDPQLFPVLRGQRGCCEDHY